MTTYIHNSTHLELWRLQNKYNYKNEIELELLTKEKRLRTLYDVTLYL